MIAKPQNKHELKTRETRSLLLAAAETIFVRDGYEGAELGEIAALAGRTKGAIYAQFKSKEEIFMALVECHALRHRMAMATLLSRSTSVEENMKALRQFALTLLKDESWALLMLEFKLFSLRHPESKHRFQEFYEGMVQGNQEARYSDLLGPATTKGKKAISRSLAVHALNPVLSALMLEAKVNPDFIDPKDIGKVADRIFNALFEVPPQPMAGK
jgi:AcrR family transcriptional regulator